jgi:hypothetical protein
MKYNKLPLKKLGITSTWEEHISRGTRGQDFGWFDYQGEPIYAMNDGIVMDIGKNSSAGNYIWIKHEFANNDMWSRYLHIKDGGVKVKIGQKVTRGQEIAIMGNTGNSTGTHLHFETWVVPKGWKFNFNDRTKYSEPSTDNAFAFDDQYIGTSSNNKVITRVIGTSKQAKRDTTKNQIEVVGEFLRARKGAGTNQTILGYIDFGIYDYIETKTSNNYTWYNLGFCWIAGTKEDTKIYPKENSEDDKDKKIAELEEQVKKLDTELLTQKTLVEKQKEEIDQLNEKLSNYANLKEHNVDKTEYIKLINGDRIYF